MQNLVGIVMMRVMVVIVLVTIIVIITLRGWRGRAKVT